MTDTWIDPQTQAIQLLEQSGYFRVLRRFEPRDYYTPLPDVGVDAKPLKTAVFVDVETTSTDTDRCGILELALVPFSFDELGNIYDVGFPVTFLNDPGVPIPAEITQLTGITDSDVAGRSIDHDAVGMLLLNVSLIVAHHADFDRRVLERELSDFAPVSWACSYREVPWEALGAPCKKLGHLLEHVCHEFSDGHRAAEDCLVGVHLLATAEIEGRPAFAHLLDSARKPTARVWAIGAPFPMKDELKARGYRWSDGTNERPKAWYRDLAYAERFDESTWLQRNAGVGMPRIDKLTARERYSRRADG